MIKHSYFSYQSNKNISWSNFTSQFSIKFTVPANEWVRTRQSYLAVKMKVAQTNAESVESPLKPVVDANGNVTCYPYLNKNPLCALFRSVEMRVKNLSISNIDQFTTSNTIVRQLIDTPEMFNSFDKNNKIRAIPLSESSPMVQSIQTSAVAAQAVTATGTKTFTINETINGISVQGNVNVPVTYSATAGDAPVITVTAGRGEGVLVLSRGNQTMRTKVYPLTSVAGANVSLPSFSINVELDIFSSRLNYAKSMQMGFDKCMTNEVVGVVPIPFFYENNELPPASEVELIFNVNSNYEYEVLNFVGASPAGGLVKIPNGTNAVANSIGVGIENITLWVSTTRRSAPQLNMRYSYVVPQLQSQVVDITSSNCSLTLNFDSEFLNRVFIAFIPANRGNMKRSSTDFSSGYTNANPEVKVNDNSLSTLNSIQIQYGSSVFPSPNYDLNFKNLLALTNPETKDMGRAYYELISQLGSRWADRVGAYSLDEWENEPIFVYNLPEANPSRQMVITLRLDSTAYQTNSINPMQLFVLASYNQYLSIVYKTQLEYTPFISDNLPNE